MGHVHDQILAEMVLISPNITAIVHNIAHHVASVDRKTVNWTWLPFKMRIQCYHFRIQSFYSSLCFTFILWFKVLLVHHVAFPHETELTLSTLCPRRRITNCKLSLIKVNSQIQLTLTLSVSFNVRDEQKLQMRLLCGGLVCFNVVRPLKKNKNRSIQASDGNRCILTIKCLILLL